MNQPSPNPYFWAFLGIGVALLVCFAAAVAGCLRLALAALRWKRANYLSFRDVTRFPRWLLTRLHPVRVPEDGGLTPGEMADFITARRAFNGPAADLVNAVRSDTEGES